MTVTSIYSKVFELLNFHKKRLAFALLIPCCLFLALEYILMSQLLSPTQQFVVDIFSLFIYVFFAINIHRILLLGAGSIPLLGYLSWGLKETKFLGYLFLIGLIFSASLIFITIPLLNFIALIGFAWLSSRYTLVLPATALQHKVSLSRSWNLTHKHSTTIFFAMYSLPILVGIGIELLANIGAHIAFISLLTSLVACLAIAIISVIYKFLIDDEIEQANKETIMS